MGGYTEGERRKQLERFRELDPEHRAYLHERIRELHFQGEENEFFFEQLPMMFLAIVALFAPAAFYLHERLSRNPSYENFTLPLIIALLLVMGVAYGVVHHFLRKKDDEIRCKIQANYDLLLGRK